MYMSVHTQSMSLSRVDERWLSCKGLKSSLCLHTHLFVPLKDDSAEMDLQDRLADSRIMLVACCAYIPEAQELTTHTSQQGQVGMCISESSRALPNFP